MNPPRLFASLLLLASLPAQSPPCASLNDQNTNVSTAITSYGFAGPNVRGWQFIPQTTIVAQAVQLYTGNTQLTGSRFMTVEIWSENPATNLPMTRLAGGTWQISSALGNSWQGANLDAVTPMVASTPYWIVWIDPGFSTLPIEPGGVAVPTALGSWTSTAASALKCRLFCGLLDGQNVSPFGSPCAGSTGRLGTVFTNQAPTVGNAGFTFEGTGFPSGVFAILALGRNPNWISIPVPGLASGCMQNTDIFVDTFGTIGTGNTRGPTAAGQVTFALAIPPIAAVAGTFVAAQIAALDTGLTAPIPLMVSNALRVTVY